MNDIKSLRALNLRNLLANSMIADQIARKLDEHICNNLRDILTKEIPLNSFWLYYG